MSRQCQLIGLPRSSWYYEPAGESPENLALMRLEGVRPKRSTSRPAPGHRIYPYLLRDITITRPDQAWASDITSIPLQHGFLYLTAVMDLYSRNVLSWRLSTWLCREHAPRSSIRIKEPSSRHWPSRAD